MLRILNLLNNSKSQIHYLGKYNRGEIRKEKTSSALLMVQSHLCSMHRMQIYSIFSWAQFQIIKQTKVPKNTTCLI